MLDTVDRLADDHWLILIPAGEKGPRNRGWGTKRLDPGLLKTMLHQSGYRAGIGILLGPGRAPQGAWLADFEGDGPEAKESLSLLLGGEITDTLAWDSDRGSHYCFIVDDDFLDLLSKAGAVLQKGDASKTGVYKLGQLPDLEIRIGGTKPDGSVKQVQSVIPPTPGTSGNPRRWIPAADGTSGPCKVARLPASARAFLKDLIAEQAEKISEYRAGMAKGVGQRVVKKTDPFELTHGGNAVENYARKALDLAVQAIESAPEGRRNHTLNCEMFSMGQLVAAGALIRSDVESQAGMAARRSGMDNAEILATIRSGLDAGILQPRDLSHVGNASTKERLHLGQSAPESELPPRYRILVTPVEYAVADEAVYALRDEKNLFQRANSLVNVMAEVKPKPAKDVHRPSGNLRIMPMPTSQVRRLITRYAEFIKKVKGENGPEEKTVNIPGYVPDMVSTMGTWPDFIRPLEGIVEAPTLRRDGSLIDRPGYDPETGLWFQPGIEFKPIPERPTKQDAARSVDILFEIVNDFPFAVTELEVEDPSAPTGKRKETHHAACAAWLAALLTPLARFMIDGPTPLFLFDANTPGTGKSKLCDIIAVIATGREMARGSYPDNDEEMQKMMLSVVMADDRLLLFDNVATGFSIGGSAIDRAITARTMKGRILGKSQMTPELPMNTVLYATGNNLGIRGDGLRRIVPIPLETEEERPEERKDFTIKGDLLAHVKKRRGELVAAALTILRAYIVAGKPEQNDLTPMDFPAWSGLVRNAINWVTGIDPCLTRTALVANDEETNQRNALVAGWLKLCDATGKTKGMTAAEVVGELTKSTSGVDDLYSILCSWSRDGALPSARTIGNRLNKVKNRNCGGRVLKVALTNGMNVWYVIPLKSGSSGSSASDNPSVRNHPQSCSDPLELTWGR